MRKRTACACSRACKRADKGWHWLLHTMGQFLSWKQMSQGFQGRELGWVCAMARGTLNSPSRAKALDQTQESSLKWCLCWSQI